MIRYCKSTTKYEETVIPPVSVRAQATIDDLPDDVRSLFVDMVGETDFSAKFYNQLLNDLVNPETTAMALAESSASLTRRPHNHQNLTGQPLCSIIVLV